jgi:hypothetical protein
MLTLKNHCWSLNDGTIQNPLQIRNQRTLKTVPRCKNLKRRQDQVTLEWMQISDPTVRTFEEHSERYSKQNFKNRSDCGILQRRGQNEQVLNHAIFFTLIFKLCAKYQIYFQMPFPNQYQSMNYFILNTKYD